MDRITFSVNGEPCSAGSEVDSDETLNDFLRKRLNLRGTKYMCKEGGCGVCIVAVTVPDADGKRTTLSIDSCLTTILSCQDWEITTVEGIGNRQRYHPIQRTLAKYNGSQCGYCTPGWIMSMYSLLENKNYDLTEYEVENSFGGNQCRCTGYRSILDAFRSFAKDAPKPNLVDIEDLKLCKNKGTCNKPCEEDWCVVPRRGKVKKIYLSDHKTWYRVNEINDVFEVWRNEGTDSYMLVDGNTGRGAIHIFEFPRVLIDISAVYELKIHYLDQNLIIGAGTSLTNTMQIFKNMAEMYEEFSYLEKLYEHLDLVAHIPVRNVGSIAGNLMLKQRDMGFQSDLFLLLEAIGAFITIVSAENSIDVTLQEFLSIDMRGKIITAVKIPPLSDNYKFASFKVTPRSQNAVAQVHGAFLYELDPNDRETVKSARIIYGGLSRAFTHAYRTELYLKDKKLFENDVLQGALNVLNDEIVVEEFPGMFSPDFRKKAALGLFYKGLLNIIPAELLNARYASGAIDLRKYRPLSKGTEIYDTNPVLWPLNEPMPKVEALIQCAGEALYVNDLPTQRKEVYCAFVTAKIATGKIEHIDPSEALSLPGVLAFYSAKDIPGKNILISGRVPLYQPQILLAEDRITHFDQPIGIIAAETEVLANRAVELVHVTYKKDDQKPLLDIRDVKMLDPSRITLYKSNPAEKEPGVDVHRVIKETENIFWQYHYTMETQSCVTRPSEDGIDVLSSTQYPDMMHLAISELLNIEQSRINLEVPRCGGAYGAKITRSSYTATASALVTYLLNRPCRFVMDIQPNIRVIGKRLPCNLDYEVAVNGIGEIQYLKYNLYQDTGYKDNDPVGFLTFPGVKNCYDKSRWNFSVFTVTTDTTSNTYARSPGSFETVCMTEHVMERIAYELDLDPLQVRMCNLNSEYTDVKDVLETLLEDSDYEKRKMEVEDFNLKNRWMKRGLRVAIMSWPGAPMVDFHIYISIYHGDGSIVIKHGGIEIGQGINTKVIQTVAFVLRVPISKIKVKPLDVASVPNNFSTVASRTTQAICFGAIKCCQLLLDRLAPVRKSVKDPTWENLVQEAFEQGINLQTSYQVNSNDQEAHRTAGIALSEVELDILTGECHIRRVDLVEDVGTSVNPEIDIGQIQGAFTMGIGYWTTEQLIYDKETGQILTDRTWNYHIPQAKDIPIDFRIKLRKNHNPVGTLGSRSVAEPATCLAVSVAFALKAAIAASREETGFPRNQWFNVEGTYSVEANVLHSQVNLAEFLYR
ncbi:abscisic-aldehyde oxidase-like [Colias croceus]|uniref:abscisic-aldehyde oxidase-like n=1 Tax=Colias crocea TaxID=72248 RepID=UPI001E280F0E|nr:abscisic-aldehyde oxidase-like [Colias croceus]